MVDVYGYGSWKPYVQNDVFSCYNLCDIYFLKFEIYDIKLFLKNNI